MHPLVEAVVGAARTACGVLPDHRVLIAVSGGADSTALLLAWHEASVAGALPPAVAVAHLHHGMRGDAADGDLRHVSALAQRCTVPFLAEHAFLQGANEAEARAARYAFFERAAGTCGADHIATGHHADDQAETVLLRLLRGTSVDGLAGIPPRRRLPGGATVVRPLLGATRAEIAAFLSERGVEARHDVTNEDPRYPRGRVRRLLPSLADEFNPRLTEALVRLAAHAARDRDALEGWVEEWFDRVVSPSNELDGAGLAEAPEAVRSRVLLRWIRRVVPEGAIEAAATAAWVDRLEAVRAKGGVVVLPGELRVERAVDGSLRVLSAEAPHRVFPGSRVRVPGRTDLPDGRWIEAQWLDRGVVERVRGEAWLPAGIGTGPLCVRGAAEGDRLAPFGMGGRHRLVRDLLREHRVPVHRRSDWPVVVDGERVLWVAGVAQSEEARCDASAGQVLRLRLGN
ncbi:MAG: tRNA lysidine(34) synthetase TilS [Armatimonadota bacterium]